MMALISAWNSIWVFLVKVYVSNTEQGYKAYIPLLEVP